MELRYRHSESINELAEALCKAQSEMEGAKKDSVNPHFKNKYADLESVWDACRKPLATHGLAVLQPVAADGSKVTVSTVLAHKSGQWFAADLEMTAQQNTPQSIGSAITYGRRYGLSSMVGIAPEDDDGNEGSVRQPQPEPQRAAVPKPQPAKAPAPAKPQAAAQRTYDHGAAIATTSAMKEKVGEVAYRRILGAHGYEKANEIPNREQMKAVYEALVDEAMRLKESGNNAA